MGAGNSAVIVDLPRWGPMLSPRVPNLVPIPSPRMERETPGQRPRPNYGHPHASVLQRGWSITRLSDGTILRSANDAQTGDTLVTQVANGVLTSTID